MTPGRVQELLHGFDSPLRCDHLNRVLDTGLAPVSATSRAIAP